MRKLLLAILATLTTAGLTLGVAAEAQASTGYKARTCYSQNHDRLTVSSWINSTGTKTWHWNASASRFHHVHQNITGGNYYATEGYFTNAYTGDHAWIGYWPSGGVNWSCSLVV